MILGDTTTKFSVTLDELFCRAVRRRPAALMLVDPPNRRTFADGAPCHLTYAAADRMVSAIAGGLHRLGLAPDSVIALQVANTVDGVLALLGVLRAGLIPTLVPLLWRRDEIVSALAPLGAKAIIACGRIGDTDLQDVAANVAVKLFSIRYVCGFGEAPADGVISLSELSPAVPIDPCPDMAGRDHAAAHLAAITWETTAQGHVPIARNHAELIAAGMTVAVEGKIAPNATILATPTLGSFAALALGIVPALLTGGTLVLHQAFDPAAFAEQCAEHDCDTIVVPAALLPLLLDAGLFAHSRLRNVLAVWRNPERLAASQRWSHPEAGCVDVQVFGETALIARRRGAFGLPEPLSPGPVVVPRGLKDGELVAEVARTKAGTLALRGPMVPQHPFPDASEKTNAARPEADGFIDTGYPCRIDRDSGALEITGPPANLIGVGGYRFIQQEIQNEVGAVDKDATIAALPDAILNHRLAGSARDRRAVQQALLNNGINPLLAGAFRDRRKPRAA